MLWYFIQFVTKNISLIYLYITHVNKKIVTISNTTFLWIALDNTLTWKTHKDIIIPTLSSAYFAIRAVRLVSSQESLKMVYFSYCHSIMKYGVIIWGNSCCSENIFRLKTIRIIIGIRNRDSCSEHFRKLKILPLQCQRVLSLSLLRLKAKIIWS